MNRQRIVLLDSVVLVSVGLGGVFWMGCGPGDSEPDDSEPDAGVEDCSGSGMIRGTAVDEEGTAIAGMRVFALSPPSGEVTASFSGETDEEGNYSFPVDSNREYRITSQIVVDSRYMTAEGTEICTVQCDGSVSCSQLISMPHMNKAGSVKMAPLAMEELAEPIVWEVFVSRME